MPSSHHLSVSRRALVGLLAAATAIAGLIGPAGAAPATDAPAPTTAQVERVAERYNLARLQAERATALVARTEQRIAEAEARVAEVRTRSRARIASMYKHGGSAMPFRLDQASAVADLARRAHYMDAAEKPDRELLADLSRQLRKLGTERAAQRDAKAHLQRTLDTAATMKRKLDRLAAEAAARARADAEATADAAGPIVSGVVAPAVTPSPSARTTSPTTRATPNPTTPPTSPPPAPSGGPPSTPTPAPSGRAGTVVAYARAQLGKPYVFATAGPNTFDCSGLTMAAWSAAGVRMPHYSGSQATMFPKVSWDQLQPGDIVVFYGDLHHVGLYIGGGMMIHAPQTGDVVKIAPAWRTTFQWGVRPG